MELNDYYFSPTDRAFKIVGIHDIEEEDIAVSEETFRTLGELHLQGRVLYLNEQGVVCATEESKPSPLHEWDGKAWVVNDTEYLAFAKEEAELRLHHAYTDYMGTLNKNPAGEIPIPHSIRDVILLEISQFESGDIQTTPIIEQYCLYAEIPADSFRTYAKSVLTQTQLALARAEGLRTLFAQRIIDCQDAHVINSMQFTFEEY